jgi:hypothetical protein
MASEMQDPAGQDGACESTHVATRDASQNTPQQPSLQDNVVGTISKNQREHIRVSLRTFGELRQLDLRVFKNLNGDEIGTAQGLPLRAGNIDKLIELLQLAKIAAKVEGLL